MPQSSFPSASKAPAGPRPSPPPQAPRNCFPMLLMDARLLMPKPWVGGWWVRVDQGRKAAWARDPLTSAPLPQGQERGRLGPIPGIQCPWQELAVPVQDRATPGTDQTGRTGSPGFRGRSMATHQMSTLEASSCDQKPCAPIAGATQLEKPFCPDIKPLVSMGSPT